MKLHVESQPPADFSCKKRPNETPCPHDIFYSVHAPLDIDTRKQHGLTLIHVEKIDFIAKTCKHNMYTDMFYFFIYFIVFFLYF